MNFYEITREPEKALLISVDTGDFDAFDDEMYIPAEYTGKLCHTYIDEECGGEITDYQGHTASYYEKSYIHLDNEDYSLSIKDTFMDFITRIKERTDSI